MTERPPVRPGAALAWTAKTFRDNAGILMALASVVAVVQIVPLLGAGPLSRALADCTGAMTADDRAACTAGRSGYLTSLFALAAVSWLLALILQLWIQRAALRLTAGESATRSVGESKAPVWTYIGFSVCYWVLLVIGTAAFVIPMFVVMLLFQFAPYAILGSGASFGAATRRSLRTVKANVGGAMLVVAANALVWLPWAFCGWLFVLTIFTLPFATLFTAHMYRQFNGEPIR